MFNTKSRIPVIPLSYEDRHLAVPKELIIDNSNGNIYVVSSTDNSVLYNITDLIKETLYNMPGDQITVIIEGIGEVNLGAIIKQLKESAVYTSDFEQTKYVGKQIQYDNNSIILNKSKVQLVGYSDAEVGFVAKKGINGLDWMEDKSSKYLSLSSIVNTIDPDDNDIITLLAEKVQKTNITLESCTVIFPTILDTDYSKMIWKVSTGEYLPIITFPTNIIWEYENSLLVSPNSIFIYEFETWDQGTTWLAKNTRYGQLISSEAVTVEYLSGNLYDKNDIQVISSWKEE